MIPIAIKLFLGGIWKRLTDALGSIFSLIGRFPWQAAVIALCALLAWQTHGKGNALDERDAAIAGRKADRLAYIDAQAKAERLQRETDHVAIDRQIRNAELTEQAHVTNQANLRRARSDYARANPVRLCRQTPNGEPGSTLGSAVPSDPGQPADPDTEGEYVAVSRPDFDALTTAAMQAAEREQFLTGLIAGGLAVKASDLPTPAF